jgi:uncharacterized 2Fe-2S/4Fe-4S cluster protein (DUF4445 family)
MSNEALVVFMPSGRRGRFALGTPLLGAARDLGVDIDSVCGGRGMCGRCQINVATGEFSRLGIASSQNHLSVASETEKECARRRHIDPARRLSCASQVTGDLVIDVPPESQIHKQIIRKRAEVHAVQIDPVVHLHYVEVPSPTPGHANSKALIAAALATDWDLGDVEYDKELGQHLDTILAADEGRLTLAVRDAGLIIGAWPGLRETALGLAIDIGTTTLAAHLCDLSSGEVLASAASMNPQIRFGEDVMSRISYAQEHADGSAQLTACIRASIAELASNAARDAGVDSGDIIELCIVGNPTMHHLLLGLDPTPLGRAPFTLGQEGGVTRLARELDIDSVHTGARAYVLPCIAGHVGADMSGVLLSEAPHQGDDMMLVADIGTNAEIALGNRHRLVTCSSPTGPACEGAHISCGQRAAPGAIERVRIDRTTLKPRIKVIGSALWSDEAGFADDIAETGVTGICGSGITEAIGEMVLVGLIDPSGLVNGATADLCRALIPNGRAFSYRLYGGPRPIDVTQTDVRAIQLAKSALCAGIQLLMDQIGTTRLDRLVLAGAFGSYIDPHYARVLGMFPDCEIGDISAAGNAAGTGARIALLNKQCRLEAEHVADWAEKIETATADRFQKYFVAAMAFPAPPDWSAGTGQINAAKTTATANG